MNHRRRPLALGPLRAFEAVARRLNFSAAAQELNLTQSAVSRQIRALEDEIGAPLFVRGTRHVELTADGATLLRAALPAIERLDAGVRQIRQSRGRKKVSVSTFASFSTLWLIPRLEAFQRLHPDIDIRVSAQDAIVDLDEDADIDLALRYCRADRAGAGARRLFGEILAPVISPWLAEQAARGAAPPLARPADLSGHTLTEEDDHRYAASQFLSWRHWLGRHGLGGLQPRRWMYFNFTSQQMQAALAGQAVALARVALVDRHLERGELLEPFGTAARIALPYAYWLVPSPHGAARAEVRQFADWIAGQAAATRAAIGDAGGADTT